MEAQAQGLTELTGGNVHVPIPKDASLLIDIGCGTGAVTISLGLEYPKAQVIGVDLSAVPAVHEKPPNVTFLEGDIFDLVRKDNRIQPGTADFVHSRLLVCGMQSMDWATYVQTAASLLKPGGYLELIDIDLQFYQAKDYHNIVGSGEKKHFEFLSAWREACQQKGVDMDIGSHLEQHFKDAGMEDVQVKIYPWPNSDWPSEYMPQTVKIGKLDLSGSMPLLIKNALVGTKPEEKIKQYEENCREYLGGNPPGCYMPLYVVTGMRPKI